MFSEWLHVFARVLPSVTFPLDWALSNSWAAFLICLVMHSLANELCCSLVVEKAEALSILSITRTVKVGP